MGDRSCYLESTDGVTSPTLVNEEDNTNKIKLLSNIPEDTPVDSSTPSLTEFPRYEVSEKKSKITFSGLNSEISEATIEEQELEESQQVDWDDPIAFQLEELLTSNLMEACESAVKKVTERGYTREVAEWAILNSSVFYGSKDTASNLANGALALLKRDQEFNMPKYSVFDGFQKLVDYTLLEMIHVIREIKPGLTISESMWCLLLSDMNLLNLCVVEKETNCKAEISDTDLSDSYKLEGSVQSKSIPGAESSLTETNVSVSAHKPPNSESQPSDVTSSSKKEGFLAFQKAKREISGVIGEKSGVSAKKGPIADSKRDTLRQKAIQFEKTFKGRMSKGAFKAKVAAWGNMVLDKSINLQSSSSSAIAKGVLSKPGAIDSSLNEGTSHPSSNSRKDNTSSNSQFGLEDTTTSEKDSTFASPSVRSESPGSFLTDRNSFPKVKSDVFSSFRTIDYLLNIPFDETLRKFVPQDEKDETILTLIPHKHKLKKELKGWTEWANEKIMEVAKRLGKDQGELKMLRQEKEELEKLKRDQQNTEESNLKRVSEMKHALANTTGQSHMAHSNLRLLERENSALKEQLEAARDVAFRSAVKLKEAVMKEQEALKKLQLLDAEKTFLQDERDDVKSQAAELGNRVKKVKEREDQIKLILKQEEKLIAKVMTQIESLRQLREVNDALTKEEEDNILQMAETNKLRCIEDIQNLETMISKMRVDSERSKIAALNMGFGNNLTTENKSTATGLQTPKVTKRLAVFQGNFGGSVKPERECVMCMTREISVVFLPCAHQVLCEECNVLHEKKGLSDCPSCRTMIQKRISISYRIED